MTAVVEDDKVRFGNSPRNDCDSYLNHTVIAGMLTIP